MEELVIITNGHGVMENRVDLNAELLTEAGLLITEKRKFEMNPGSAKLLCGEDELALKKMLIGPVVAFLVRGPSAFEKVAKVVGEMEEVYFSANDYVALRDKYAFFPQRSRLERTLVIIKPGYTQQQYKLISDTLDNNDFAIIARQAKVLSAEEAVALVGEHKEHIDYLTSDVSVCLVAEKIGAIDEWRLLMGPEDPQLAKSVAAGSLRALAGTSAVENAVYGSASPTRAVEDVRLLFPSALPQQRTLAIIKPSAFRHQHAIMEVVKANGFHVVASEEMYLSAERCDQLFAALKTKADNAFAQTVRYMTSGPIVAMVLSKPGAVDAWLKLIGPEDAAEAKRSKPHSLRARFGTDLVSNGLHGSVDAEAAQKEIDQYFPQLSSEKLPTNLSEVQSYMNKQTTQQGYGSAASSLNSVLSDALVQLCRVKPQGMDAIKWLADWLANNNPNKPRVEEPTTSASSSSSSSSSSASVVEADDSSDNVRPRQIVWVVGGPGSGRDVVCTELSRRLGFQTLSMNELAQSAIDSGSQYAEVIADYRQRKRLLPAHITTALLQTALQKVATTVDPDRNVAHGASARRQRVLVLDFPQSLDHAFDFEDKIGPVSCVLHLEAATPVLLKRAQSEKAYAALDAEALQHAIETFQEDYAAVIEHYRVFNKVKTLDVRGTDEAIVSRAAKLLQF